MAEDNEILANILRRFLSDPDTGYGGYWFIGENHVTLDKKVQVNDEEQAAILRFLQVE